MLSAIDEAAAVEHLHEIGATDGLPVIVPTPDRVERLVLASGLDPDIELGEMGPGYGIATVEKVATAAVMAGCLPDFVPVVVAAVRAVCQPEFDLTEMQCTTHCIAPMIVVSGPVARDCGFAGSFGLMGPGHRANATVGRALRLCMMNIGGARPGESDMAIHGSPAKFGFCFTEDVESSPFAPVHTSLGYQSEQSAVIVLGVEGPHSALFTGEADDRDSALRILDTLAAVIANRGSNNVTLGGFAAVAVVLNPEHADILARHGFDRATIQNELAARAVLPREVLLAQNPKMLKGDETLIPAVRDPANILLMVGGAPGLYSMVMPSWCAGPHGNVFVHSEVELNQFCELPTVSAG